MPLPASDADFRVRLRPQACSIRRDNSFGPADVLKDAIGRPVGLEASGGKNAFVRAAIDRSREKRDARRYLWVIDRFIASLVAAGSEENARYRRAVERQSAIISEAVKSAIESCLGYSATA